MLGRLALKLVFSFTLTASMDSFWSHGDKKFNIHLESEPRNIWSSIHWPFCSLMVSTNSGEHTGSLAGKTLSVANFVGCSQLPLGTVWCAGTEPGSKCWVKPKLLVDNSLWDRHHERSLSANQDFQNNISLASTVGLIMTDCWETLTWRLMSNQSKVTFFICFTF